MTIDDDSLKFARYLAGIKARQIKFAYRSFELDDLEQILVMEVLVRWPSYSSGRGCAQAYIETVIQGKVCKIIRSRKREIVREQEICRVRRNALRAQDQRSGIREVSLRHDVAVVIEQLPRHIAEAFQLLEFETRAAVAGATGFSRNGLNAALVRSREKFRDHSLDLYL